MSTYIDDNDASPEIKNAAQNLISLGENYRDSTARLEDEEENLSGPKVFGKDRMGQAIAKNYPDVRAVLKNRAQVGDAYAQAGKNVMYGTDVMDETDIGLAEDLAKDDAAVDTAPGAQRRR